MNEAYITRLDRRLQRTPLGRLYAWQLSVPGALLLNTPTFNLHTELRIEPHERVLDLGCGRGSLLQVLSSRVRFEQPPVGLEASRALLRHGADSLAAVPKVQASAIRLPLADETFDVVTCGYLAHHLEDQGLLDLLQETYRVLKPGGLALVWDYAPTRSPRLNGFHRWLLEQTGGSGVLRTYATLSAYALQGGFNWVTNAHLRPFLFPPIPRVSVLLGKAPEGWTGVAHARGLRDIAANS